MKRLLLLGCLMMLIGCVRQKTDAKYWMLKGRIAEMRERSAVAYLKFGKRVPDTIDSYDEIHTFDHSGRWMESRFFEKESYNVFNSACFSLIAASEYSSSCISISSCVQLRIATMPLICSFAVSDTSTGFMTEFSR